MFSTPITNPFFGISILYCETSITFFFCPFFTLTITSSEIKLFPGNCFMESNYKIRNLKIAPSIGDFVKTSISFKKGVAL